MTVRDTSNGAVNIADEHAGGPIRNGDVVPGVVPLRLFQPEHGGVHHARLLECVHVEGVEIVWVVGKSVAGHLLSIAGVRLEVEKADVFVASHTSNRGLRLHLGEGVFGRAFVRGDLEVRLEYTNLAVDPRHHSRGQEKVLDDLVRYVPRLPVQSTQLPDGHFITRYVPALAHYQHVIIHHFDIAQSRSVDEKHTCTHSILYQL
mmetsp:Transcript_29240/g.75307  ORF Transcript_29240/g.75307 Transcript_29240/m.75307 type:complete len:204 (+) Transcript_29240:2586-3197(+)